MIEISSYLLLLFISLFISVSGKKAPFWPLALAIITYIATARLSRFDVDMETYAAAMRTPLASMVSPYYLREASYWLTSNALYKLIGSASAVFIIFDIIAFLAVYSANKRMGLPPYLTGVMFLSFESVMGFQNVYRQFLASCILFFAFSHQSWKRYPLLLLAGTIHNAALLFVPLLFCYKIPPKKFLFTLCTAGVFLGLPFVASTKSSKATGLDLTVIYVFVIFVCLFLAVFLKNGRFIYRIHLPILFSLSLSMVGTVVLASAQAERIAMMCLFLMTPLLVEHVEDHTRVDDSLFGRSVLILALALPALAFPASRVMLVSGM